MEDTCVCCNRVIPENTQFCPFCFAEPLNIIKKTYAQLNCPECGAILEVYYDGPRYNDPDGTLIRHCKKCLCDWENEWFKDGIESELKRKFWG